MVRRNGGESMLISNDVKNTRNRDLIICHSLLHQENLFTKSLKVENVVTIVSKLVNFVTSKGMNNRQFKNFMRDMNSEYGDDDLSYMEVRWLSSGCMLEGVDDRK